MQRKAIFLLCAVLGLMLTAATPARAAADGGSEASYVSGVVRVKLQPELASRMQTAVLPTVQTKSGPVYLKTGVAAFDRVSEKARAVRMTRVFPAAGKYEARHKAWGLDLWYDITYEETSMTTAEARSLYQAVPGVTYAGRVPVAKPIGGESFRPISPQDISRAAKSAATMPFNDPLLKDQWHYHNDGSMQGAKAGADANLFQAWESGVTGSKDVLVAIIDGGFQTDHPDLKDNVWINEAELNGKPGVDDDNDGYVDDIYGYNFVIGSADLSAHSHGTHVAGTVGATNGNGIGVCGVAGGSDGTGGVKMMVCQVFDSRASQSVDADFAAAIVYAADKGAAIAQCSWGYAEADIEDKAVTEAVKYFTKNGGGDKMNGGLCIFSAGNTGEEGNYYPGCLPEVVAVGAMTASGTPAYYSSRGSWVDVSAPGGLMDDGQQYGVLSTLPGSTYGYNEGTSMACPHVSGIAALILSKYGNKNFSNETLRTLLTSSVNDLYADSPSYEGLFGAGYIDAYKALQGKEGSVPGAVSDYTLTPSHDNVLIEWTIPESDEKVIDHHVVYYSTQPITEETNLNSLPSVSVDTKFKYSGDQMQYELTGLKATTTYYFTLVAYNRWGTPSARSAVKSATTNAGPTAVLSTDAVTLKLDASKGTTATGSFDISNTGKGVLKYELAHSTRSVSYSMSDRHATPSPGRIVPFSGKMGTQAATTSSAKVISSDYEAEEWPKTLSYYNVLLGYLGDTDPELPNAMAQLFTVDKDSFPDGFNLTALNIAGAYGENPVIEIYSGSQSISAASLLERVDYDYFIFGQDVNLGEQLFFSPGESFWVVVKFAAGQSRPLAAGRGLQSGMQKASFYSSDNGATWTQLSEVVKDGNFAEYADVLTWAIAAKSKNPDWSTLLSPDPASGEVREGGKQTVTVSNDGQKMVNGRYKFNLRLKTNEAEPADQAVTVDMTVSGNKPDVTSRQLTDFGNLIVGQKKTLSVELTNKGYGYFGAQFGGGFYTYDKSIVCSSDQFDVSDGAPSIDARSSALVPVTFAPTKAGDFSGTVTLKKNGYSYSFTVRGTASDPAKLAMDSTSHDFGDLEVGGAEKTATFTLRNEGKYPLQYIFPKFSSESIEGATEKAHKYGYTYVSNLDGDTAVAYEPVPELTDETDITSQFSDNTWLSGPVNVGFSFPFYGGEYDQVYITSHGGIAMHTITGSIGCFVPQPACMSGLGYISAYGNSGYPGALTMVAGSRVTYGHKEGKLYVVFKDCQVISYDDGKTTTSFHIVLSPDGSAAIYYDDYDPSAMRDGGQLLYIGTTDAELTDPFTVTDADHAGIDGNELYQQIQSGTVIKIVAPATSFVKSVSSSDGYVGIGESKDITVTVAAGDDCNAGAAEYHLVMLTNDPDNASKNIVLRANITGDGLVPVITADSTQIDFGRVYLTSDQTRYYTVHNTGRAAMAVTSATATIGTTTQTVSGPVSIAPRTSKDFAVTVPTDERGIKSGTLKVVFGDGTEHTVPVTATVIGKPELTLTPESMSLSTTYLNDVDTAITLTNSGDEPLSVSIAPDAWYSFRGDGGTGADVDYTYQSASDGYDVSYDWADITSDYDEHMPMSYYLDKTDYKEVTLPFAFPFYGKTYTKMYIYDTGFVSFDEPTEDYKQFPEPPAQLPSTDTFYKNMICPFWGNHSMATDAASGAYYKAYDDHAVVSYMGYGNSVMSGMNFQVLLYPDGTFKFQYKVDDNGMFVSVFGLCGVMNDDCTKGVNPSDMYISPGNAVVFRPVMRYSVASGKSVTVPVSVKADKLADTYSEAIAITTDEPHKESVSLPVTLEITGEAKPVFPSEISVKQVYDPNYTPGLFEFEVSNEGTRAFTIDNAESTLFDFDESLWTYEALLYYWGETSSGGDDPGPLSLHTVSSKVTKDWISYQPGVTEPITVGLEPVRFRIVYYNTAVKKEKDVPLTFTVSGLPETTYTSTIKVHITDAPKLTFDRDSIYIGNAAGSYSGQETVTLSNTGKYPMTYSLRLDPSGNDEAVEDNGGIDPMALPTAVAPKTTAAAAASFRDSHATLLGTRQMKALREATGEDAFIWDLPSGGGFTNSLYYPILQPTSAAKATIIGTGSSALGDNFYAATRYTSPAEGFNLTHLYFVGTVGDLKNVDIEASVILGSDVTAKKRTIGHGKLRVESESPNSQSGTYNGEPRLLKFDKPVYVNPGDTFFVVLKYPAGYAVSADMTSKDGEMTPGRYMAFLNSLGGWVDIEEMYDEAYSYGAFGYCMSCIEHEPGKPWITMSADKTEGTLAVGEKLPVTFDIHAESTYYDKGNRATLVVHTDDPDNKTVNYHVTIDKNAAPAVTLPKGTPDVAEGDSTVLTLTASDEDGDAFTLALSDDSGIAAITAAAGEGVTLSTDGTVSVAKGQTAVLTVTLRPGYETAGNHTATLVASDALGNRSETDLVYHVSHTNRAPVIDGPTEITVAKGAQSKAYSIYEFAMDPDYDDITFTATTADTRIAEAYTSASGLVVAGNKVGETTLTLIVTDTLGASTKADIAIHVVSSTGIGGVSAGDGSVSVDTEDGTATVIIGRDVAEATLTLYDNGGKAIARREAHGLKAGDRIALDGVTLTPGVYHLAATLDGETTTVKFAAK